MFILALSLIYSLTSSKVTNAASSYDNVIETVPDLVMHHNGVTSDASVSWSSVLSDACGTAAHDSLLNATSGGGHWMVLSKSSGDGYGGYTPPDHFIVIWSQAGVTDPAWSFINGTIGNYTGPQFIATASATVSTAYLTMTAKDVFSCSYSSSVGASSAAQIVPPDTTYSFTGHSNLQIFLMNYPVTYPSGYEGPQIPYLAPSPRNYVALGDSFSSGEGNAPYITGTDISGTNECHRSSDAYPTMLADLNYLNLTNFAACSGATTDNISTTGQWNEDAQYGALVENTNIASLTIGGNDIDFKDYAYECTMDSCDFSTSIYSTTHDHIVYDLPTKLLSAFDAIKVATEYNPNIKVYVLGYPYIVPAEIPTDVYCPPFNGGSNNPDPTLNNGAAARTIETDLNNTIEQAVASFDSMYSTTEFQYVTPNGTSSPFLGHDWCSSSSYFHDVDILHPEVSYHPTVDGQRAYAKVLQLVLD